MARPSRVFVVVSTWAKEPGEVVGSFRRVQRYVRSLVLREAPALATGGVSVFDEHGGVVLDAEWAWADADSIEVTETLYLKGGQWRDEKRRR